MSNFNVMLEAALALIPESLTAVAPAETGVWEYGPPGPDNTDVWYRFSLPSDPDRRGALNYYVKINNGDISFGHNQTGIHDRTAENQGKKNLAYELFPVVQYCVKTYIEAVQPDLLKWVPVTRSERRPEMSDKLANRNARDLIYDRLAKRGMQSLGYVPFPGSNSMYVRGDDAERIVADYYHKVNNSHVRPSYQPQEVAPEPDRPSYQQQMSWYSDNDDRPDS